MQRIGNIQIYISIPPDRSGSGFRHIQSKRMATPCHIRSLFQTDNGLRSDFDGSVRICSTTGSRICVSIYNLIINRFIGKLQHLFRKTIHDILSSGRPSLIQSQRIKTISHHFRKHQIHFRQFLIYYLLFQRIPATGK